MPYLMDLVIVFDNILLEKANEIGMERAINLQKTANVIFKTFFTAWISNDETAWHFLLNMKGFDFLLKRLFTLDDNPDLEVQLSSSKKKFNVFDLFLDEESKHVSKEEEDPEWVDMGDEDRTINQTPVQN